MANQQWSNPKDIQIPNPFGFIAGKTWGNPNAEPVLALHGWQDNAGTFDRLIPLLSSQLYIVAIDAPGHGLSSHKPPGAYYHFIEMVVDIKRVVDYLKWESFSLLGHSMGGALALMFASIYPENVKNLVLLDIIKPASRSPEKLPEVTKNGIASLLNIESKLSRKAPVYTLEDARARLIAGMYNEITSECAEILLKRGCKPSDCGKGVVFSRDIRVQGTEELQKLSHVDLMAYMSQVTCNLMVIKGKNSMIFRSRTPEVLDDFINLYRKNCSSFQLIEVEGNHFVHLNNPDQIAPHIDAFFQKHNPNLSKI